MLQCIEMIIRHFGSTRMTLPLGTIFRLFSN